MHLSFQRIIRLRTWQVVRGVHRHSEHRGFLAFERHRRDSHRLPHVIQRTRCTTASAVCSVVNLRFVQATQPDGAGRGASTPSFPAINSWGFAWKLPLGSHFGTMRDNRKERVLTFGCGSSQEISAWMMPTVVAVGDAVSLGATSVTFSKGCSLRRFRFSQSKQPVQRVGVEAASR